MQNLWITIATWWLTTEFFHHFYLSWRCDNIIIYWTLKKDLYAIIIFRNWGIWKDLEAFSSVISRIPGILPEIFQIYFLNRLNYLGWFESLLVSISLYLTWSLEEVDKIWLFPLGTRNNYVMEPFILNSKLNEKYFILIYS